MGAFWAMYQQFAGMHGTGPVLWAPFQISPHTMTLTDSNHPPVYVQVQFHGVVVSLLVVLYKILYFIIRFVPCQPPE